MKKIYLIGLVSVFYILYFPDSVKAEVSQVDSIVLNNRLKIEFRVDVGNVFPTNSFVRSQNNDPDGMAHYNGYSLRLARQTTGKKLWEQVYAYPNFGIGVYSAFFTNTKNLGNPVAAYGFFNAPFFKVNRFSLNYELGLGMAFNWNHYNPVTNPGNIAISTDNSVFIDAGISLKYMVLLIIQMAGYSCRTLVSIPEPQK